MPSFKDLTGKRFGKLVVVEKAERPKNMVSKGTYWRCLCDCGNERIAHVSSLNTVKSCGCDKKTRKHGLSRGKDHKHTRLYGRWSNIKDRCCNPNSKDYERYGGRGIKICDEWKNDFLAFYNWSMNNGYSDELQIDREDNSKGYSPENCRWVTTKQNSNNRRSSIKVSIWGCEKSLLELSEEFNVPYQTLWKHFKIGDMQDYISLKSEGVELKDENTENGPCSEAEQN